MENDLKQTKYKLKKDSLFGYKYLDLPLKTDLKQFYKKKYYEKIRNEGEKREAKLLSTEKELRTKELQWLQKTYFMDRLDIFTKYLSLNQKTILDIGCGTGEFLEFMKKSGWKVFGIEPSKEAFQIAKEKGITVYNLTLEEFFAQRKKKVGSMPSFWLMF